MAQTRTCPFRPSLFIVGGSAVVTLALGSMLAVLLHLCAVTAALLLAMVRTHETDPVWDTARDSYTAQERS